VTKHADLSNLREIANAVEGVRFNFIAKLEGYQERLIAILEKDSLSAEAEDAIFAAHRIRGVAGTFGYADLGRAAEFAEGAFEFTQENGFAADSLSVAMEKLHMLSGEIARVCSEYHQTKSQ